MKTICISEHFIRNLFNNLIISEETRQLLHNLITRYDHDYVKFIFAIYSVYTNEYVNILSAESGISERQYLSILQKLSILNIPIHPSNIFVGDKFDILYGISYKEHSFSSHFNSYFYEDIYSRLENLTGVQASEHMEEVFESIENVVINLETNLISISEVQEGDRASLIFYIDVYKDHLIFVIV